jgi:hypothetical protein
VFIRTSCCELFWIIVEVALLVARRGPPPLGRGTQGVRTERRHIGFITPPHFKFIQEEVITPSRQFIEHLFKEYQTVCPEVCGQNMLKLGCVCVCVCEMFTSTTVSLLIEVSGSRVLEIVHVANSVASELWLERTCSKWKTGSVVRVCRYCQAALILVAWSRRWVLVLIFCL